MATHVSLRPLAGLFAGLLLLVGTSDRAAAQRFAHEEVIEREFTVRPGATLFLDSDLGSVAVEGRKGDEVVVTVIKGVERGSRRDAEEQFARFDLRFDATESRVEIEGDYEGRRWGNRNLRVRFEITVPYDIDLDIETAGGSLQIADIDGQALLHTSGGSIRLTDVRGRVDAHTSGGSVEAVGLGDEVALKTSGGSITVREAAGSVIARTSGGSIRVEGAGGPVSAQTSGGSIKLYEIAGAVEAKTSGGSVEADVIGQPEEEIYLQTSGGSVTLHLDPDVGADLDATASGGRVQIDFPITLRGEVKRTRVRGELNGGGPRFTLRSSGGGVRLVRR